jgi:hypothetical protein
MRFIVLIIFLFTVIILNGQNSVNNCHNENKIGNKKICLPAFNGMIECIENEKIKVYIEKVSLINNRNIAFYLNEETYSNIEIIDSQKIDDYLIIFTSKNLENDFISNRFINQLDSLITDDYKSLIDESWGKIQNEISSKNNSLILEQPLLIDHFYVLDSVPCIITISHASEDFTEYVYVTATVFRSLNDKFVAYAYYLFYNGEKSIREAREKIEYFTLLIDKLNISQ